jgi:hypothetical protein
MEAAAPPSRFLSPTPSLLADDLLVAQGPKYAPIRSQLIQVRPIRYQIICDEELWGSEATAYYLVNFVPNGIASNSFTNADNFPMSADISCANFESLPLAMYS